MSNITKNILSLNHEEAVDFFMKSEQYHGFELPEYFTFDELLKYVRETIGETPYEECLREDISPDELTDVNLDILLNKDSRYVVYTIMLANSFLIFFSFIGCAAYRIGQSFRDCSNRSLLRISPHVQFLSFPEKKVFHNATTITFGGIRESRIGKTAHTKTTIRRTATTYSSQG